MSLIVRTKAQAAAKPGVIVAAYPHFTAREMACPCCGTLRVRTELLSALEALRGHLGHALPVVSGYRCPTHNKAVGGVGGSQHVNGTAADISPQTPHGTVTGWRLFSGVGWVAASGLVVHIDVRHVVGAPGTVTRPATWTYPL